MLPSDTPDAPVTTWEPGSPSDLDNRPDFDDPTLAMVFAGLAGGASLALLLTGLRDPSVVATMVICGVMAIALFPLSIWLRKRAWARFENRNRHLRAHGFELTAIDKSSLPGGMWTLSFRGKYEGPFTIQLPRAQIILIAHSDSTDSVCFPSAEQTHAGHFEFGRFALVKIASDYFRELLGTHS
jgi:hypothetical protein